MAVRPLSLDGYEARIAKHDMRCGGCGNGVDTGDKYGAAEIIVAIAVLCMDCIEFFDDEEDEKGTETTYLIAEILNTGDWGILGEFVAADDDAANAYAEEHYNDIDWYVLYQSTQVNING